jgi:hypothetical protein
MDPDMTPDPDLDDRLICSYYVFWALCRRAACRRRRACLGPGAACLQRFQGLVPLEAQELLDQIDEERSAGRSAAEVLAGYDSSEDDALAAWIDAALRAGQCIPADPSTRHDPLPQSVCQSGSAFAKLWTNQLGMGSKVRAGAPR